MASYLKSAGDFTKNAASQGAQGVAGVGNTLVGGIGSLNPIGKKPTTGAEPAVPPPEPAPSSTQPQQQEQPAPSAPSASSDTAPAKPAEPQPQTQARPQSQDPTSTTSTAATTAAPPSNTGGGGGSNFLTSSLTTVSSTLSTGVTTITNPAVSASKAGGSFLSSVASTGFDIGSNVARTGANVTANVLIGTVDLAGTAVGGVVKAAADTSGKVFEPVASGLKAIDGLEKVGEGLETINGLPVKAIKELGTLTMKSLNMSGITPTFFDPDGDGIVTLPDTIKGLIILGLAPKSAQYAAYALHSVFSYPTAESWIPTTKIGEIKEGVTELPIHVERMGRTRWGTNWGTYERVEWCRDVDFNTFFETSSEETGTYEKWKATFTKGRQHFGILLLIFEWGTTWPFVMPPVPAECIPFREEMGVAIRKLVLPTILRNYNNAHQDEEGKEKEAKKPPSEEAPVDCKDA